MTKLFVRRLISSVPLIFIVSFAVFLLVDLSPGDPAARLAGENATAERIEEVRQNLGLDEPVFERYADWLGDAVHGDFGRSLSTNVPVRTLIGDRLTVTLSLALVTLVLTVLVGGILGIVAALRPGGLIDKAVVALSSVALAIPSFWLGLVLVSFFAVNHQWLPAIGYSPLRDGVWEWLKHLLLPAIALATVTGAETTLQLRAALVETLTRDFVLTAEAKGLARRKIVGKHTLKNAAIPVVTVLGFRISQILGGAVIVESVFNLPGLGGLVTNSVLTSDIPVLLGLVVLTTVLVVLINLLVDLSYGYFNPKVRA